MLNKTVILFLVAIFLFQVLHGGLSSPRLPRSTDTDAQSGDTNVLTDIENAVSSTLGDFNNLLNQTDELRQMMQSANSSLQTLSSALDVLGDLLSGALQNATRTLSETNKE